MRPYLNNKDEVTPCRDTADRLARALAGLRASEKALAKAVKAVPDYTGPNDPGDYYANEQEARNRAAEEFEDALVASLAARGAAS